MRSDCQRATPLRNLLTADGERPHAVRVCPHCHTVWNRDVNAARNMRCLLECVAAGQARPAALRRPAQRRRRRDAAVPELEVLEAIAEGAAMDAALEEVGD